MMNNRREDAIERALDEWWDGITSGQEVATDSMLSSVTTMTVERLHAEDDAPAPSSAFVQLLREDLTRDAEISASSWSVVTAEPESAELQPERLVGEPKPKPFRIRRGRALLELAAVAVLVLGLVSTMFGGSPFAALNLWPRPPVDRVASDPTIGMYRGDAARTGVMPGPGPVGQPVLKWKQPAVQLNWDSSLPVVANNQVFLVAGMSDVIALDLMTGEVQWRTTVGPITQSQPAVGNGLVYIATNGPDSDDPERGYLVALDASTGSERWRYVTGDVRGTFNSSPAFANGMVFVTPYDETLRAVDALTGTERWRFDLATGRDINVIPSEGGLYFPSSPSVADGVVYAANDTGQLFAIDVESGEEKWRYQSQYEFLATPVIADDVVYLSSLRNPMDLPTDITSLDAKTGAEEKTWAFARNIRFPPVVVGDFVYVSGTGESNDGVTAIEWSKGTVAWEYRADNTILEAPIYADGILFVSSGAGVLDALDANSGSLIWRSLIGSYGVTSPAVASGLVIVGAMNGLESAVYAIGGDGNTKALGVEKSFDVSGLPPCEPFRPEPNMMAPGTPAASLEIERDYEVWGSPELLISEIPEGEPASADAIDGIEQTLRAMANCNRFGMDLQRLSFYSNDFFRREWVERQVQPGPYSGPEGPILSITNLSGEPVTTVDNARLLPDGRVGVLILVNDSFGSFIVFVKQGDHWYIDETFNVVPQLGGKG